MNKIKNIIIISFLICLIVAKMPDVSAQYVGDLRLNEILIKNDSNYVDEYGRHVPWIEVFNSAYNSVNIGGCYLTNDTNNPTMYPIPKTDPKTLMPQRSHVVFYMDNSPKYGTFHVNFDPYNSNYVALYSSNGKTLIDILEFPEELRTSDNSFGRAQDGDRSQAPVFLKHFTPGSTNETEDILSKNDQMRDKDPIGLGLTVIAMSVVFGVLIIIFLLLKTFKWMDRSGKKKVEKEVSDTSGDTFVTTRFEGDITGEELGAISIALHIYLNEMHDEESEIITIENESAHYSPWSQKNLVMRRVSRKN